MHDGMLDISRNSSLRPREDSLRCCREIRLQKGGSADDAGDEGTGSTSLSWCSGAGEDGNRGGRLWLTIGDCTTLVAGSDGIELYDLL